MRRRTQNGRMFNAFFERDGGVCIRRTPITDPRPRRSTSYTHTPSCFRRYTNEKREVIDLIARRAAELRASAVLGDPD